MIRRPPRSTLDRSSAASDVYKRQAHGRVVGLRCLANREVITGLGVVDREVRCGGTHASAECVLRSIAQDPVRERFSRLFVPSGNGREIVCNLGRSNSGSSIRAPIHAWTYSPEPRGFSPATPPPYPGLHCSEEYRAGAQGRLRGAPVLQRR